MLIPNRKCFQWPSKLSVTDILPYRRWIVPHPRISRAKLLLRLRGTTHVLSAVYYRSAEDISLPVHHYYVSV